MLFATISQARSVLSPDWGWPNFSVAELACRCGGRYCGGAYWHAPEFLDRLQALRDRIGRPLHVTSGHRCALWNASVGGAPRSQHKQIAVDLALAGHDRDALYAHARASGFTGFGLARSFIHLDCRHVPAVWFYPGSKDLWQT